MAHDVFISYSSADLAAATAVRDTLVAHRVRCWMAPDDIPPGALWASAIVDAITDSKAMVLVFSASSNRSPQVVREIERAANLNLVIIPFRVEDVAYSKSLEYFLSSSHWHDATTPPLQPHLERLAKNLTAQLAALAPDIAPRQTSGPEARTAAGPVHKSVTFMEESDLGDWENVGPYEVRLQAVFDRDEYAGADDPYAYLLLEAEVRRTDSDPALDVPADIALVLDVSKSMRRENRFQLLEAAVRQFFREVGSKERVAIVAFSTEAQAITKFAPADTLRQDVDRLIRRIQAAGEFAERKTNIIPALTQTAEIFRAAGARKDAVRRTYVLTDGGFHDARECGPVLADVRDLRTEIGIYAFGTEVRPDTMKRLLTGQMGGWVKPIADPADITRHFARIAEVNHALVGQEARIVIKFDADVTLGHVWSFRPYERHFGQITKAQNGCDIGFPESDRTYSLLFEVRLPPDAEPRTRVAKAGVVWRNGERQFQRQRAVFAARTPGAGSRVEKIAERVSDRTRAGQAFLILDALRHQLNTAGQLARENARLKVALFERRSDDLIETIQKMIAKLERELGKFDLDPAAGLDDAAALKADDDDDVFDLSLGQAMIHAADWDSGVAVSASEKRLGAPAGQSSGSDFEISLVLPDEKDED